MKAKEVYGEDAFIQYGGYERQAGIAYERTLQPRTIDWRDSTHQKSDTGTAELNSKERKYHQMQSSIFGGGYAEKQPLQFDPTASKINFGSNANWSHEAALSKPDNRKDYQM